MKRFFIPFFCAALLVGCSDYASKDAIVELYEQGVREVGQAGSEQQIDSVIYEVTRRVAEIGNGPEGEKKLSASDNQAIVEAQLQFIEAVQERSKQLSAQTDSAKLYLPAGQ